MSSTLEPLVWHNEKVKWNDMIPYVYNPRKMSSKKKERLRDSYNKFGDVETPVLDFDNLIIAGHQRQAVKVSSGFGDEFGDVRKPNRKLTEEEYKEYNIISNALKGDFVGAILAEHFSSVDNISDYDILLDDISKIHDTRADKEDEPEMPIVKKMSEKYSSFVIICENEIDENHLAEKLGIDKMQCYKSSKIATTHVVAAKTVIERWNK